MPPLPRSRSISYGPTVRPGPAASSSSASAASWARGEAPRAAPPAVTVPRRQASHRYWPPTHAQRSRSASAIGRPQSVHAGGAATSTRITVAPTRTSSPSRRSTSAVPRRAASSGLSPGRRPPWRTPFTSGTVEAAEVPEPGLGRVHLPAGSGDARPRCRSRRAGRGTPGHGRRGRCRVEVVALAANRAGGDDEADRAGHRDPARMIAARPARAAVRGILWVRAITREGGR